MIKIKSKQALTNFKGETLKNGEEEITIGTVISAILGGKVSNPTLGWTLGKKFATEEIVDLKAEDVVFIKKELESNEHQWTALVIGQVLEILETPEK